MAESSHSRCSKLIALFSLFNNLPLPGFEEMLSFRYTISPLLIVVVGFPVIQKFIKSSGDLINNLVHS